MYFVYVLRSDRDGSLYIGYTSNLRKRFIEHNTGASLATKYKRPYSLIYYEAFIDRVDAQERDLFEEWLGF